MLNCTTCERFDGHKCLEFGHLIGMAICPYAVEKKPSNNYEMIQAMSMEELAKRLCCPYKECRNMDDECNKCLLDWLKEEVDHAEEG